MAWATGSPMPDPSGGRSWGPGGRPFPPSGGSWRGSRRRFARRIGLLVATFVGLMLVANAIAWAALSGLFGHTGRPRSGAAFGVLFVGLFVAVLLARRAARRMAEPV